MSWRHRSIHARLMSSFVLLVVVLLLLVVGAALVGFAYYEQHSLAAGAVRGRHLGAAALYAMALWLTSLLLALPLIHRLVKAVSDPLAELARRSQLVIAADAGTPPPRQDEVERLGESLNHMVDSLARSRDQLRALNARLQAVREEERTRIAREIHDELGQRLTAIKLDVARRYGEEAGDIAATLDQAVQAVREISWELRPSVLDTLGLTAAIEWLGEDFQRRMATRCKVSVPQPAPAVDADTATELFRICQELLTNITRHARASRVDIALTLAADELHLEVRDNGVGIAPGSAARPSLGLLGIRERAQRLGGRVRIASLPEIEGTRVSVAVPWRKETL